MKKSLPLPSAPHKALLVAAFLIFSLLVGITRAGTQALPQATREASAMPPPVSLRGGADEIVLHPHMRMLVDNTRTLTPGTAFHQIEQGTGRVVPAVGPAYRSPHPHWGALRIHAESDETNWILFYRLATIERLEMFQRRPGQSWVPVEGLHQQSRLLGGYHYPSFALALRAGETIDIVVRLETRAPIRMALRAMPGYAYFESQRHDLVVAGMTLAIPLVVLFYLALLLVPARNFGVGWFFGLVATGSLGSMWVSGHGHVLVPQISRAAWPAIGYVSYTLMVILGWMHAQGFLQLTTRSRRVRATGWLLVALVIGLTATELSGLANTRTAFAGAALSFAGFIVMLAWQARLRDVPFAILYASAWFVFVFGAASALLGFLGLPTSVVWTLFYAQSSVPALLFGLVAVAQLRARENEITRARREQSALSQEKMALEAALRARLQFFAATNHDLRQPLQSLGLYVDLALREAERHSATVITAPVLSANAPLANQATMVRYLQQAKLAFSSSTQFLESLLDLARVEGNAYAPQITQVDAGALLTRLRDEYRPLAGQYGLELRLVGKKASVLSDSHLLERILRNLLSNALRHTTQGGVLIALRPRNSQWRIDVIDTGPGLSRQDQERLFGEFARLTPSEVDARSTSTHAHTPGFGLGLFIVKRFADALGHQVLLSSRPGHGSRFSLLVARAHATATGGDGTHGAAPESALLNGIRIGVLEDERDVAAALHNLLTEQGARTHVAPLAAQSLASAASGYDVLLADYRLGFGLTLADILRTTGPLPCPVVVLTGSTETKAHTALKAVGIEHILLKPIDTANLCRNILRATQRL